MEDKFHQKYLKYKDKYLKLKQLEDRLNSQTVTQKGGSNKKEIYLFKADWCGHCKAFKPVWDQLETNFKNKYSFKVYDADKNEKEIKEWQIGGFPTVIAKEGAKATEYVGPRDYDSLKNFFESV